MLDPVREKRDLHIRAAGIFVMQLELLEIQRLVTLSHNEGPIVAEEPSFATAQRDERWQPWPFSRCHWAAWPFLGARVSANPRSSLTHPLNRAQRTSFILKLGGFPVCRRTKG